MDSSTISTSRCGTLHSVSIVHTITLERFGTESRKSCCTHTTRKILVGTVGGSCSDSCQRRITWDLRNQHQSWESFDQNYLSLRTIYLVWPRSNTRRFKRLLKQAQLPGQSVIAPRPTCLASFPTLSGPNRLVRSPNVWCAPSDTHPFICDSTSVLSQGARCIKEGELRRRKGQGISREIDRMSNRYIPVDSISTSGVE